MNRWLAYLFIVLFWAAAYLPGLDSKALRGEEARRALPAVEILESGNWLVPHLNGQPYLRKPPLLNWAIAESLRLVNYRDEWVVRLPSVLAMLALATAVFWTGVRWLSTPGAFAASIISLSGIGLWEKGQMAEIDALYSALTGAAFAFWLAAWVRRESGWRLWLAPVLCLAVACLSKGPLHLLLFYSVAIPLLVASGEQRQLWSRAHFVALGLGALIVASWLIPYLHATASLDPQAVWANQMQNTLGRGKSSRIWVNELSTLGNGLPWVLFIPFFFRRRFWTGLDERRQLLLSVTRWVLPVVFFGLMLIPGMIPRYTLPLYTVLALMLAMVIPAAGERVQKVWKGFCAVLFAAALGVAAVAPLLVKKSPIDWLEYLPFVVFLLGCALVWRRLATESNPLWKLAAWPALAFAAGVAVYAAVGIPRYHEDVDATRAARGINDAVPKGAVLHIVHPGYEPSFFYIERYREFVPELAKLPRKAHYILITQKGNEDVLAEVPGSRKLGSFPGLKHELVLLYRESAKKAQPSEDVSGQTQK